MFLPSSTYRIQTSAEFTLKQIQEIIDYLEALGISTIYSAPFFQATEGSTHGYDVVDPHKIGESIGDHQTFVALAADLKKRGMSWLQDIVPNHMAFTPVNPWIRSILELGEHSPYYRFFDINWLSDQPEYFGKVMTPFLGSPLEDVLSQHQLQLVFNAQGFNLAYFDNLYPLNVQSYVRLLSHYHQHLEDQANQQVLQEYTALLADLEKWNQQQQQDAAATWQAQKKQLQTLAEKYEAIKDTLSHIVEQTNRDAKALENLLHAQNFKLTYWKDTESAINYRRFFTVNDLICLNAQEQEVFEVYHQYIKKLVDEELVQGLRVDHVDGLFDPTQYLQSLRKLAGKDTYLIVEKILEAEEHMPGHWPIQGSSGYEFLAQVNQLYTDTTGEDAFNKLYEEVTTTLPDYDDMVFQNKLFILLNRMHGELNNLLSLLKKLEIIPYEDTTEDEDEAKMKEALAYLLAAFPVYRIYSNSYPFSDEDMQVIAEAFKLAESKGKGLGQYFERLHEVFNGVADRGDEKNDDRLYFVMRCQQFTGPLAAKGVEDTTFYVYNRLISRNEVGDTAGLFGISADAFHEKMANRQHGSLNASSTHDTKRGEDARMRINVLSEIPEAWQKNYRQWQQINQQFLIHEAGKVAPDDNDQYFLYQTIVGTYPLHKSPKADDYTARVKDYMLKVLRESKRNTSWSQHNESYEQAMQNFVEQILKHQPFLDTLVPFVKKVAHLAVSYSLGQTLLKVTAPGIPDVYQGSEYWDLSMVDPDNRRPVDYQERMTMLKSVENDYAQDPLRLIEKLCHDLNNPAIKLFTLLRALQTRKSMPQFFAEAGYQPLQASGSQAASVLAFMRENDQQQLLVVVPLNIAHLILQDNLPVGEPCWQQTSLVLDDMQAGSWKNILTGQSVQLKTNTPVAELLAAFPVALLIKQ